MAYQNFTVDADADGIAVVTWDMPGRSMNVLDTETIEELGKIVGELTADAAVKGVVVTSGKDTFSGGADLTLLETLSRTFAEMVKSQGEEAAAARLFEESRKLSQIYRQIEKSGKPAPAEKERFAKAAGGARPGVLIGHIRAASKGIAIDDAHAHPFADEQAMWGGTPTSKPKPKDLFS